eukprot:TRINITY_DN41445_c0_g1_i1.p1 TRINITY_DN41445_c0_g1~~TRINITY_DN41445_c0_g1_i1.p1  ORF type:complete len:141 (-),score=22.43 TRINITY_DN41445_c0_g1_i1:120-542(-)
MAPKFSVMVLSAMVMGSVSYRIKEQKAFQDAQKANASAGESSMLQVAEELRAAANTTGKRRAGYWQYVGKCLNADWLKTFEDMTDGDCTDKCDDPQCVAYEFPNAEETHAVRGTCTLYRSKPENAKAGDPIDRNVRCHIK